MVAHQVSGFPTVTRTLSSLLGLLRQQRSEQTACIHYTQCCGWHVRILAPITSLRIVHWPAASSYTIAQK